MIGWLVLSWFLSYSNSYQNQEAFYNKYWSMGIDMPCYEQNIGLTLTAFDHVRASVANKTYAVPSENPYRFRPFRNDYIVSLEIFSKYITVGASHECDHEVYDAKNLNDYMGNFTKIYVIFHGDMRF